MIKKEKQLILLDWLKRFLLCKILLKLKLLKSILTFTTATPLIKLKTILEYNLLDYKSTISKPKLRCIYTARSHALKLNFKVSRFTFRRLISNKLIPYITRPSW